MGKKDKKRSAEEAGLVEVTADATSSAGVGLPTADAGEVSTMSIDGAVKKKKSKKEKSSKKDKEGKEASSSSRKEKEKDLEIPADHLSPIAHPLAGKKLAKKTLKTVKKVCATAQCAPSAPLADLEDLQAARARHVKRGVKEVVKALKKNEKGCVPTFRLLFSRLLKLANVLLAW